MWRSFVVILMALLFGGCNDDLSRYDQYDYIYCDNVRMWFEDAHAGVSLEDRRGWAPILEDHINCTPSSRWHRT